MNKENETENLHVSPADGKLPVSSSSNYYDETCDCCGDYPCSCSYEDDEEDPFSHPIAASCTCGAYQWSVKKGCWLQFADCCC